MQKKLLSLAIASALAVPGAAMADVRSESGGNITIYGKLHSSWDYVDNSATNDDTDDNTAAFRNSRLGFKGSENLGGGLKGIWQVETQINTAGDNMDLRNTFVGLEGDQWGRVFFGMHDTPYKMATAKLDIFSDTIADYNNVIGAHMVDNVIDTDGDNVGDAAAFQSDFNEREPQVVAYVTPNFNGFQGAVARESWQNVEAAGNDELEGWSAMAMYDQGPFFASLAYELERGAGNHSAEGRNDIDAWKIGLGYTFGNGKITGVYEDIDHDANNDMRSRDAFWGSFSYKFGANVAKLAYGKIDDSEAAGVDDGADTWAIGVDHNFSKRTKVYAIYTRMDNDRAGAYGLYAGNNNGANLTNGTSATTGWYTSDDYGKDIDAFSLGIIHKF